MTKKFKLDPSIEQDDITINAYQEKIQALPPKDDKSLYFAIPFEAELDRIRKELDHMNNERMKMFIGNALIELARVLTKRLKIETINDPSTGRSQHDPSTGRLQQFASIVTDAQLQEMNIPTKFWKPLRNLHKIC